MKKLFCVLVLFLFVFFNYTIQLSADETPVSSTTTPSADVDKPTTEIINEDDYEEVLLDDEGNIIEDSATPVGGHPIKELENKVGKKSSLNIKKAYHSEKIMVKKGQKVKAMYGGVILEIDTQIGKNVGGSRVMRLELFNGDELVVTGVDTKGTELKIGDKVQVGDYIGIAYSGTVEIRLLSVSK
jgi:hypothetical protein